MIYRARLTILRQRIDAAMSDLLRLHTMERVSAARLDNHEDRIRALEDALASSSALDARTGDQV